MTTEVQGEGSTESFRVARPNHGATTPLEAVETLVVV